MKQIYICALFILSVCSAATAQDALVKSSAVEFGYNFNHLSNGYDNWQGSYLRAEHKANHRNLYYAGIETSERFSLDDQLYRAGIYITFSERWSAQFELSTSPTHKVRPTNGQFALFSRSLEQGWVTSFGFKRTQWQTSKSVGALTKLEKYWNNYRLAGTVNMGHLQGGDDAFGYGITFSHYYSDSDSWNISLSSGDELERVSSDRVLKTAVTGASLYGLHYFNPNWALRWSLSGSNQGELYDMKGLELGVRYKF